MIKFFILSRDEINKAMEAFDEKEIPFAVISISSPDDKTPVVLNNYKSCVNVLKLCFSDGSARIKNQEGWRHFEQIDAEKILEFYNIYKDKVRVLLCHCDAGISRSAGVIAALSMIEFQKCDEYFNSKLYLPNLLVYSLILQIYAKQKSPWLCYTIKE